MFASVVKRGTTLNKKNRGSTKSKIRPTTALNRNLNYGQLVKAASMAEFMNENDLDTT